MSKEKNYLNDLSSLQKKMKDKEKSKEPLFPTAGIESRTPELLQSEVSKKLLRFLISKYSQSDAFQKHLRSGINEQNFYKIKDVLDNNGDLSLLNPLSIDTLYTKLLMIAPLTEVGDSSVFGRMAKQAHCTEEEFESAVKLLSSYRDSVHKKFLKEN